MVRRCSFSVATDPERMPSNRCAFGRLGSSALICPIPGANFLHWVQINSYHLRHMAGANLTN